MVDRTDDPYNLATLNSDQLLAPAHAKLPLEGAEEDIDAMTAPDSDFEQDVVTQRHQNDQEECKEPLDDTRFEQLTQQALQQPSTLSAATPQSQHPTPAVASVDGDKIVPVVQVHVSTNADATVSVELTVTTRYVPHLNTDATATLLQSVLQRNNMQAVEDDNVMDDSDDEDNNTADLTGNDFEMTGDLQTDRQRLLELIGGTASDIEASDSDVSSSSSDDEDGVQPTLEHHLAEEEQEAYDSNAYIRSKNEVEPTAIAVEPITIPAEAEILLAGQLITPNVDGYSVVQGIRGQRPLGLNSVLCHADRSPLGRIEEVIGNVSEPFYTVRASKQHSSSQQTAVDDDDDDEAFLARLNGTNLNNSATPSTPVYYVPSLSQFAQADQTPGSDASNLYDEEVADHEREYSDDEDEAAAKAARKSSKKRASNGKPAVSTDALPQQQHPRAHTTSPRQHQPHNQHSTHPTTYAPNYQLNSYQPVQPHPTHYAPQHTYQQPYSHYQHPPPQYPSATHNEAYMLQHQQAHQYQAPSGYQPVAAQSTYQQSSDPNPYQNHQSAHNPYNAQQPNNPYYAQQSQNPYVTQHSNNPYYQQHQQHQTPTQATQNVLQRPPGL